jgi:hypothetical protein
MPRDQISEYFPPSYFNTIYGAAYKVVPPPLFIESYKNLELFILSTNFAQPKSQIKYYPSDLIRILSGFKSKCQQAPCRLKELKAWQI